MNKILSLLVTVLIISCTTTPTLVSCTTVQPKERKYTIKSQLAYVQPYGKKHIKLVFVTANNEKLFLIEPARNEGTFTIGECYLLDADVARKL